MKSTCWVAATQLLSIAEPPNLDTARVAISTSNTLAHEHGNPSVRQFSHTALNTNASSSTERIRSSRNRRLTHTTFDEDLRANTSTPPGVRRQYVNCNRRIAEERITELDGFIAATEKEHALFRDRADARLDQLRLALEQEERESDVQVWLYLKASSTCRCLH